MSQLPGMAAMIATHCQASQDFTIDILLKNSRSGPAAGSISVVLFSGE